MDLGRKFRAVEGKPQRAPHLRAAVGVFAILSGPATPSYAAFSGFAGTDGKATLEACAAERTPLLERQKQYAALRRERLSTAALAGAKVLVSSGALGMVLTGGASGILSKALAARATGGDGGSKAADYAKAVQAISVIVAVGGAVDAYMKVKQEQFDNDPRRISQSIDTDAGLQVSISEQTAKEMGALADCRASQVADYRGRLAAAANDRERKDVARGQAGLKSALKSDIELTEDLAGQQATMLKTFAQGRAMAEGKSEADILESDTPAYGGEVSKAVMKMPEAVGGGSPPVVMASYVTVRATGARSAPDSKAAVIMNLPAGRTVMPKGHAAADASWWEVDVAGTPGFIRGADLADPSAAPAAKGKARTAAKPAPPPPQPPNNVRTLNRQILDAKAGGAERLKALSVDVQAALLTPAPGVAAG